MYDWAKKRLADWTDKSRTIWELQIQLVPTLHKAHEGIIST